MDLEIFNSHSQAVDQILHSDGISRLMQAQAADRSSKQRLRRFQSTTAPGSSQRAACRLAMPQSIGRLRINSTARGAESVSTADIRMARLRCIAARNGHTALVQAALAAGADLKALNRFGSTALMGPAYRGHVETVRVLLGTPIDLHHVNDLGWTALLEAIVLGTDGPRHREIVRMLIASGSDVQARDRDGVSALQHAQTQGAGRGGAPAARRRGAVTRPARRARHGARPR